MSLTADRECETVLVMTRNLLLVAVLLLAAACGKKPPKGDCAKAIDNAMSLSKEDYKRSGVAEETQPKIRAASLARCNEDKWPNVVLVCLEQAKTTDDVIKCQKQMSKEQQENMAKSITAVISAAEKPVTPEAVGSGTGAGTGAGTADTGSAALPAGMPAECAEYKAVIDKLSTCDKLPQPSRDMLKQSFETTSKSWADFDKLPDTSKAALANTCKQGVEAVKKAAGATCAL